MFQTRVIKIQPEYRKNKFTRKLTPVPSLKLSGNWLEAAGFHTGKIIMDLYPPVPLRRSFGTEMNTDLQT